MTMICDFNQLSNNIKHWAKELGFSAAGIADCNISTNKTNFQNWLKQKLNAEINYLEKDSDKIINPQELMPDVKSIICCSLNYWPKSGDPELILTDRSKAYISRYALGRDYHKVMKKKLQSLAKRIQLECSNFNYRCFSDSAPVMEKAHAVKAGIGWQGNNSLIINPQLGTRVFLGEIYTNLPLKPDQPIKPLCANCTKCIDRCPTQAIIEPQIIDVKRCISYLTLEYKGIIPVAMRSLIGNRIYGCDDCQLACPWNRLAEFTQENDFLPRNNLDNSNLIDLFALDEKEFLKTSEGSAIRRIGYERWQRNLAIALGNAGKSEEMIKALKAKLENASPLVSEHIVWALEQHCKIKQ